MEGEKTMDPKLISAFGKMTYGIYVLTAAHENEINGMIASWVSQVSHNPPLLMVAVHPNRYTHHVMSQSKSFALHVLAKEQKEFLKRFKGPDPKEKFASLQWHPGKTGAPLLEDCIARMECEIVFSCAPGNHTLFFGKVIDGEVLSDKIPLNTDDYEGRYLGKS